MEQGLQRLLKVSSHGVKWSNLGTHTVRIQTFAVFAVELSFRENLVPRILIYIYSNNKKVPGLQ